LCYHFRRITTGEEECASRVLSRAASAPRVSRSGRKGRFSRNGTSTRFSRKKMPVVAGYFARHGGLQGNYN
jgi:hypothetical protein